MRAVPIYLLSWAFILLFASAPVVSAPPDKVLEALTGKSQLPTGVLPGGSPTWIDNLTATRGPVEYPYDPTMPLALTYTSESNRNIARYWNYRNQLRNDFMKVTTAQGGCLPAEELIEMFTGERAGHWGDSTIKLGWYMGVLATELHMLTKFTRSGNAKQYVEYGGINREHNAKVELYCALLALERLDQFAENHLWHDHPIKKAEILGMKIFGTDVLPMWPNQPGFFIRDDVDSAIALVPNEGVTTGGLGLNFFWSDLVPLGKSGILELQSYDNFIGLMNLLQSEQVKYNSKVHPLRKLKQMSQDQAIHLLMGLGLVKRFVPEHVYYNGINLRHWAISKAEDIVDWISQTKRDDLLPPTYAWTIFDPVTPEIRYFGDCDPFCIPWFDPFHPAKKRGELDPVERGEKAFVYAQGIDLAGYRITGKRHKILPIYTELWNTFPDVGISAEAFMSFLNWAGAKLDIAVPDKGSLIDNLHMAMALGAISDGWGDSTTDTLSAMSLFEDFYIYPLINASVYDRGLPFWMKGQIEKMLRGAPYAGPAAPEPVLDQGWGSENRFIRPKTAHGGMDTDYIYRHRYHGLDYMLLNNLYYIQYPEKFRDVIYTEDERLPDLPMPDWPLPPDIKLPPIGYAAPEGFNVINKCRYDAAVEVQVTVEYDDPHGDRDTVSIVPLQDGIGWLRQEGEKNKFIYTGPFWGNWEWHIHPGFRLIDEDYNHFDITMNWSYPGAIRNPPEISDILSGLNLEIDAWWNDVPLWGRYEIDYTIMAIDNNCVPWQDAEWFVVGMENVIGYKTGQNTLHVSAGVSLLQLHGSGKVTLLAINPSGGPVRYHDVNVNW